MSIAIEQILGYSSGMAISDELKRAIAESGLALNALAKSSGVSQPALWRFVHDGEEHRDIQLERTADKLAEYFGLTLVQRKSQSRRTRSRKTSP